MKKTCLVLCLFVLTFICFTSITAQPETITFSERWSLEGIKAGAWSPTGDRLAVAFALKGLEIYQTNSGGFLKRLSETPIEVSPPEFQVSWSPDGSLIAARSEWRDQLRVWDTISGQILYTFPWGGSPLAFSPDGQVLSGYTNHAQIQTWDAATGEAQNTYLQFKRSPSIATVFAWAPHGDALLFNDANNHLALFDLTTQTIRFGFSVKDSPLRQAGWTPDGRYVFLIDRGYTLHRWDAANGTPLEAFFVGGNMVSFSPDGRYFAANYLSFPYDENHPPWNVVYIYDVQNLQKVGQIDYPKTTAYVKWLAWSPDGNHLATVTLETEDSRRSSVLQIWRRADP